MDIRFLTLDNVLQIHSDQIARYGGTDGIRDLGLLESAIAMPTAQFGGTYLHPDLNAMASAYLFHIANNHPFLDGNKRVGAASAIVFLTLNGIKVTAEAPVFEELVMTVARGEIGKEEISTFFAGNSREIVKKE